MRLDSETRVERHIGELDRLRRLYKTLHRVNQSIVRSHTARSCSMKSAEPQ